MGNEWDWRTAQTNQPKPKKEPKIAKILRKRKGKKPKG